MPSLQPTFHIFGDENDDEEDDVDIVQKSGITGGITESREAAITKRQHEAELRRQRKQRLMSRLTGVPGFDGRIGIEGARAVKDMLTMNNTLTELDISHNVIGNAGVKLVCEGLKDNSGLVGIDLSDSNINEQCGRHVIKMLKGRADLNMSLRYMVFWGVGWPDTNKFNSGCIC